MSNALTGLKVLELSQNAAIPTCGRLLAGLGADVVKVEPPGGDAMRFLASLVENEGRGFATLNPQKRTVTLDLSLEASQPVVEEMFRWADVALVAFKQADLDRYQISWEHARLINPQIVHLTLSAFGPEGPDAALGGYDALVQAMSGLGFLMNRAETGTPQTTRPAIIDMSTGIMSAFAVMVALRHRDLTGEGQRVDTSLLGTAMTLGIPMLSRFERFDEEPIAELQEDLASLRAAGVDFATQRRTYEERVIGAGVAFQLYFRPYQTSDGLISIAGLSATLISRFHDITGLPRPASADPTDPQVRQLISDAEALFATRSSEDWIAELRDRGLPCTRYNAPYEALEEPQVLDNDYLVELDHPQFGQYKTVGMPARFSAFDDVAITEPSPSYGQHTLEFLAEIGFSSKAIAGLVNDGVAYGE